MVTMSKRKAYRVDFERDAKSGDWTAVIDRSQGVSCVTQGKTLAVARKRIREALALFLNDGSSPESFELAESFELPESAKTVIAEALAARCAVREATERYATASGLAAKRLARAGVSRRDAADILGLSPGRVQQLVGER